MFGRTSNSFDRLLEKATSQLLLEPDWDSILSICDCIRQGDVQPKYVVACLRKKINNENPHVAMFALQVLESAVKNCGSSLHAEIATKDFMEFIKDTIKVRSDPVKGKILELIQTWSHAFRNEASYKAVLDTFHLLKMEGHTFPSLKEADAMFMAERAPEWKDGDCCHRCRVQFTMVQRKHHCRNCGQVFCNKCSSKSSIIPKYGIEREVRVCDACFDVLNKAPGGKKSDDELPPEYLSSPLAQQSQKPPGNLPPTRSEAELQEEEELQLAIALSKSEAETKGKEGAARPNRERLRNNYTPYGLSNSVGDTKTDSEPVYSQPTTVVAPVMDTSDMDPELARYLNRNYWEAKQDDHKVLSTLPSAPVASSEAKTTNGIPNTVPNIVTKVSESMNECQAGLQSSAEPEVNFGSYQNGEVDDENQFLNALRSSVEIFCNRMRSNHQRGRSIANDSSVQTLFMTINAMHPQLMKHIQQQEDARAHYESLQDKLAQLKDAREALNALRDEYREKKRREMEELERQRQIQMAQKLEVMRQKKQEYLEFQRQLALQRMQEQEREMAMRLEQQKQMQQMRVMQQYGYGQPQMYGQPGQTFSPGGSLEGSPLHHPHPQGVPAPGHYYPEGVPSQPPMVGAAPGGTQGPPMGPPPVTSSAIGAPPGGAPPASVYTTPPGGFPPGQMSQPPYQAGPPGAFQPPNSQFQGNEAHFQQQGAPPQVQPGFASPGGVEYHAAYNMQSMPGALPVQGQPQYQQPGQPAPAAIPQPPPPQGQYMAPPGGQYQAPPQSNAMPPGAPPAGQLPPQAQPEAQLISFD